MNITCDNCGTVHDLEPPSWVVSSGRSFRFRCSACGHSQSVKPDGSASVSNWGRTPDSGGAHYSGVNGSYPEREVGAPFGEAAEDDSESPYADLGAQPSPSSASARTRVPRSLPPESQVSRTAPTVPPSPWSSPDDVPGGIRGASPRGTDMRLSVTPASERRSSRSSAPWSARSATPSSAGSRPAQDLYLKQNGQVYAVRDWDTLQRWIVERRVDAADLISFGGVRWEPVGSRPELAEMLPPDAWSTRPAGGSLPPSSGRAPDTVGPLSSRAPDSVGPASNPPPAFLTDSPFSGADGWSDDDAEGIPAGLPPLNPVESRPRAVDSWVASMAEPRQPSGMPSPDRDIDGDPGPYSADEVTVQDHRITVTPDGVSMRTPGSADEVFARSGDPTEDRTLHLSPERAPRLTPSATPARATPSGLRASPPPVSVWPPNPSNTDPGPDRSPEAAAFRSRSPLPASGGRSRTAGWSTSRPISHAGLAPIPDYAPSDSETSPTMPNASPPSLSRAASGPSSSWAAHAVTSESAAERMQARADYDESPSIRASLSPGLAPMRTPPVDVGAASPQGEFPFDSEWEDELSPSFEPASVWLVLLTGVTLLAVVTFGLLAFWPPALGPRPVWLGGSPQVAEVTPAPAPAPEPEPVVEAEPPPAPKIPEPTRTTTVALTPTPEAPAHHATASRPRSPEIAPAADRPLANLLKKAWDLADGDRQKAALLFDKALDLDPDNDEANYGLGYVRLMQGREAEAMPYLCAARDSREEDIRVDVRGLIENHGLNCQ